MTRRRGPPVPSEVEGFLVGVERQLKDAPPDDRESRRLVEEARAAVGAGAWARAADLLEAASERMRLARPEARLREWPRGLVAYAPTTPEREEMDAEEDPVANRLLLVQKLLQVRRAAGAAVDDLLPRLHAAERAQRAGDRREARRLIDEVHSELERRTPGARPPTE